LLSSSALVMLMTPALAFFYGGLVRRVNILNTMMMSFATIGLVTIQWVVFGYTFAFGGGNSIWGNFQFGGLQDVEFTPYAPYSSTIPHTLYCIYQLMFAIITGAIVSGGVAERMKFKTYMIFIFLWTTLVYDPVAYYVAVEYGWVHALGAIDFAGGTVVHITSGVSALVASIIVGPRPEHKGTKKRPSNIPYVILGGGLLWFGWFGFNSGSALAANGLAALAFANTQIATAMAIVTWIILDTLVRKHATAHGAISGAVVGLVAITPCAGFVHYQSSLAIGSLGTLAVYGAVLVRGKFFPRYFPQVDDSLDVFTCHGVGAVTGALLLGFFASKSVNSGGADGVFFGNPILLAYQLTGVVVTIVWSTIFTIAILIPLKLTIGLVARPERNLDIGLDKIYHGSGANPESDSEGEIKRDSTSNGKTTEGENTENQPPPQEIEVV